MKTTCSTTLRRTLGIAGFLIGFGLLSAGVASADEGDSPGLLGGVGALISPVTDVVAPVAQQVAPVTRGVAAVTDPVLKPVLKAAAPVTEPLLAPLAPVVDTVVRPLNPVLDSLQPVTAPLLAPVVGTVQDVPVVPRIAEPLVTQRSAPADVPQPAPVLEVPVGVPAVPEAPWTPVIAPDAYAVALPDRVAVAMFDQQQQISASDVVPPAEAPLPPSPDVPFALPGTMGSVSSSGSTSPAVSDLPAGSGVRPDNGSLVVSADHQVYGSWCYYYGRSHPS
ncbi:hypothetical protein SAMN05216188_11969 [Lentzea xinjiangensis]|uniref:Uncharacterized protein n=1 Tax=Lentzea xinjiangensis TaxID=402600 RepID=A0A1H9TUF4_9PSEU|nr:hypothetical protein [Lentzea xinjiangensis]SES00621.1 hypothetical protein SAMN05216188_11969 [Lentzea xinjiangensis]